MAFVISNKPTFWWKVKVPVVNSDKGGWDTAEFMAEYKRRNQAEIGELLKLLLPELRVKVISEEFLGWKDFMQADGKPLPVDDAGRTQLLAQPYVEAAVFAGWWEASAVGPAKN